MKNWKMILAVLVLSGATLVFVKAQTHERGHRSMHDRPSPERMMERLDLSDEQREQVKEIHLSMQKQTLDNKNLIGEKEARLKTLMSGDSDNESAIHDIIEEIGMLQTEIRKEMATSRLAVREVLDEDQRVMFDQMPLRPMGREGRFGHGPRK